jgi:hypothetical protein
MMKQNWIFIYTAKRKGTKLENQTAKSQIVHHLHLDLLNILNIFFQIQIENDILSNM